MVNNVLVREKSRKFSRYDDDASTSHTPGMCHHMVGLQLLLLFDSRPDGDLELAKTHFGLARRRSLSARCEAHFDNHLAHQNERSHWEQPQSLLSSKHYSNPEHTRLREHPSRTRRRPEISVDAAEPPSPVLDERPHYRSRKGFQGHGPHVSSRSLLGTLRNVLQSSQPQRRAVRERGRHEDQETGAEVQDVLPRSTRPRSTSQ